MGEFERSSELCVSAEEAWAQAIDPVGVNREFLPFLRMTFPANATDLVDRWQPGVKQFRSWILLFSILPVEYDDVVFEEVEPGRRFLERSSMLSQRVWEHERIFEPTATGCRVTDRIRFVPRIAWLDAIQGLLFRATFFWRHHRLRRMHGTPEGS